MDALTPLIQSILAHPATAYILGFGGEALLLVFALKKAEAFFGWSQRVLGRILLGVGALGGLLLQKTGFVTTPTNGLWGSALALFIGACAACTAAGFSNLDLRAIGKTQEPKP